MSPLTTEQRKRTSTAEVLDALHLWLHREGGDGDLAAACAACDWSLPTDHLSLAQRQALLTLELWHLGQRVALIDDAEDFHEACSDAECQAVDERVVALDGRVAFGRADEYEVDNVIPLTRKREVLRSEEGP